MNDGLKFKEQMRLMRLAREEQVGRVVCWVAFTVLLLLAFAATLNAQSSPAVASRPTFFTYVDTANVAAIAPETYVTWVYALSTPTSWPSSAIMVAFDCKARKVKRLYHIIYQMRADSLGVTGPLVEDNGEWMPVSVPRTYEVVCSAGSERPYDPSVDAVKPDSVALPSPKWSAS